MRQTLSPRTIAAALLAALAAALGGFVSVAAATPAARHSIYSFSKPARFEIELYGRDQTRTHTFNIAGSVKLGCNIHDQMRGYIRVTDTPFAGKTDNNGYVTLTGMAAGAARLTVWHPTLRAPGNESASAITITGGAQNQKLKVALR